jgi:hypothetical protein
MKFQLTLFEKSNGLLTKRISLNEDGVTIIPDESACRMASALRLVEHVAHRIEAMFEGQRNHRITHRFVEHIDAVAIGDHLPQRDNAVVGHLTDDRLQCMPHGVVTKTEQHLVVKRVVAAGDTEGVDRPRALAAASVSGGIGDVRMLGLTSNAIVLIEGSSSRRSSKRFGPSIVDKTNTPVRLPPGRLKLSTRPVLTGSAPVMNTIGMVLVAAFAANNAGALKATITATPRLTSSPASEGKRLY